jgi:Zn-dependent peptidase ImmA (M78 family)
VIDFDQIEGLSSEARELLLGSATNEWSGGACSRALPDGRKLIILNPRHGRQRRNATLMEEICHVFLGHTPNRLAIVAASKGGRAVARDYKKADEEAAYGIGAAALLPFASLRKLVLQSRTAGEIAKRFRVSQQLVEYRLKVTHLWSLYKSAHPQAQQQTLRRGK